MQRLRYRPTTPKPPSSGGRLWLDGRLAELRIPSADAQGKEAGDGFSANEPRPRRTSFRAALTGALHLVPGLLPGRFVSEPIPSSSGLVVQGEDGLDDGGQAAG